MLGPCHTVDVSWVRMCIGRLQCSALSWIWAEQGRADGEIPHEKGLVCPKPSENVGLAYVTALTFLKPVSPVALVSAAEPDGMVSERQSPAYRKPGASGETSVYWTRE